MTFGFSVGDILGGASLACQLCNALSATRGSARDYQQLIAELNAVHKVLIQVEQLRVSNQLAQATLNALLFITNAANEAMEVFLVDHKAYAESLKQGGSGNLLKDGWRKGRWALQMESEQAKLRQTLSNMLASVNCLVQLACYFNTGYKPDVDVVLSAEYKASSYVFHPPFDDVKLEASIWNTSFWRGRGPNFKAQHQPLNFFRSGQVFSLCISADFSVRHLSHRRVELSQLPLKPIATLKAEYELTQKKDRGKRLKQILSLPLAKMIQYTTEEENGKVFCTLCQDFRAETSYDKDDWADRHFRLEHWERYCEMRGILPDSYKMPSIASYLKYRPKPSITQPVSGVSSSPFPAGWISLKDITSDWPIREDWEIKEMLSASQGSEPHIPGPAMIRRFVVIQEGLESCLCLGIHTYAGLGCSNQVDQDLFAILHSSKEVPMPLENETDMALAPIRMKPEHPSTALPISARIHFGRAYAINHKIPVKSLGLIHVGSMQNLILASEAHIRKNNSSNNLQTPESHNLEVAEDFIDRDQHIIPADMEVVKDMRNSIMDVLGRNISLTTHPAPKEPPLGVVSLSQDAKDGEFSQNSKRARVN